MSSPTTRLRKIKRSPLPKEAKVPFRHSEHNVRRGGLTTNHNASHSTPSDTDLVCSMASRLTKAETELKLVKDELRMKDARIKELEKRLSSLPLAPLQPDPTPSSFQDDLMKKYTALKTQVQEMEEFLNDYGMVWVGNDNSKEDKGHEEGVWLPESSITQRQIDFDLLVKNIKYLNVLAGEGSSSVAMTPDRGATLKNVETVSITLYANGLIMFQGPFRPYSDPHTQQCIQDLMDGYFPSELQTIFPDGVPFDLNDLRHMTFVPRQSVNIFPGNGQKLGGLIQPSRIISSSSGHTQSTTSQIPGCKLSSEQFLSRLPPSVIRRGRVIDIRSSVAATLHGTSCHTSSSVILLNTSTLKNHTTSRLNTPCPPSPPPSPSPTLTTLKVHSETGTETYILRMRSHDTIADVWTHLLKQATPTSLTSMTLDIVANHYHLVSGVTHEVYSDLSTSLLDCGLTPNATLHITKKTSGCHGNLIT